MYRIFVVVMLTILEQAYTHLWYDDQLIILVYLQPCIIYMRILYLLMKSGILFINLML